MSNDFNMNTKLKARVTGTLSNGLGHPVGILPVDPRPRLIQKRSPSQVSQTSSGKAASRTSPVISTNRVKVSPSPPKQKSRSSSAVSNSSRTSNASVTSNTGGAISNAEDDESSDNDIKFIDIPDPKTTSKPDGVKKRRRKIINPQEVLEQCQECEYNKVYEIVLHGEELTEVGDLEKFRKLKILDLSCNHLKRISGLSYNQDLRELKLYGNELEVIENLNSLKDLCSLHLQHNRIKKVGSGLSSLKKLKQLRLDNNKLVKLETSDIVSCVHITNLDLSSNFLDNLKALSYLPNLVELFVSGNRLRKVTDLHRCKNLQEVDLSNNSITDLAGLNNLPNLQILDISCNCLTSLKSLGKLKSLEDINLSKNKLSELSDIPHLFPKIQILNLSDNDVANWDEVCSLSSCPNLVEISLAGNPLTLESGEMPSYHFEIQIDLPNMEVVDGAVVKRTTKLSAPLMRPMTASSIVSTRQMDCQLKAFAEEFKSMEASISNKFRSLRLTCDSLPAELPQICGTVSPTMTTGPSSSRCSSRARIMAAKSFADENFDK